MHVHKTSTGNHEIQNVMMRGYLGPHGDAPRVMSLDFEGYDMGTAPDSDNAKNLLYVFEKTGRYEYDFPVRIRRDKGKFRILSANSFGRPEKPNGFQSSAYKNTENYAPVETFWDGMFAPTQNISIVDFLHSDMVRVLMAKGCTYADASLQARMWIQIMFMPATV